MWHQLAKPATKAYRTLDPITQSNTACSTLGKYTFASAGALVGQSYNNSSFVPPLASAEVEAYWSSVEDAVLHRFNTSSSAHSKQHNLSPAEHASIAEQHTTAHQTLERECGLDYRASLTIDVYAA